MTTTFTTLEDAISYSEQRQDIALLEVDNFKSAVEKAESLGYEVNYSELDKDLYDDRETYDVWGMEDSESEESNWRLTVKVCKHAAA
jgi:hypothetical protein